MPASSMPRANVASPHDTCMYRIGAGYRTRDCRNLGVQSVVVRRIEVQSGQRFGRLTVVAEIEPKRDRRGYPYRLAACTCDCGSKATARLGSLASGHTRSCGCLKRESAGERPNRGLITHPLYATWAGMLARCNNPNAANYGRYGGRGIKVCAAWHDSATFLGDIDRLLGPRPDGMTLDRVDNSGDYEPSNVRWATGAQQQRNRRDGLARRADDESEGSRCIPPTSPPGAAGQTPGR
jgi:hypothetical protein